MKALCRRWGARPERASVASVPGRKLEAVAIENAVEGCVGETYAAVVAAWQAVHARDARVRTVMGKIAREEAQHAALSWQVGQWASRRLGPTERRRVAAATRAAIEALRNGVAVEPPRELVETVGLPTAAEATRLLDGMTRRFFATA
jgi:hypothetical protein